MSSNSNFENSGFVEKAISEMKKVFNDASYGVEHTMKVLSYADEIMTGESLNEAQKELIRITTILHDIGALEAQKKYGSMEGPYQEKEGEILAKEILTHLGYDSQKTDRISFIVGNHHTPSKIDGIDFQIVWEADLLHNLEYMDVKNDKEKLIDLINANFKTATGRSIANKVFL